MSFVSWLRNRTPIRPRRGRAQHRPTAPHLRPRLEALEPRWLPSTLPVTSAADDGSSGTLRYEIAHAQSGDAIDLSAISGQTIQLSISGELVLNKNLAIGVAAGDKPVTILGFVGSRVFEIDGAGTTVTLNNLNISDPYGAEDGGAIWNGGTLKLTACNLSNSDATLGGAIYNAGTLTVNNCILDHNTVGHDNSFAAQPNDPGNGGAIYNAGTLTVNDSTLDDNTAISGDYELGVGYGGYGGAIFNASNATASVTGGTLSGNFAYSQGGGIYTAGVMTLSSVTVTGNSARGDDNGGRVDVGGIFNDRNGRLEIQSQSSVVGNHDYDLYNLGWVKISKDSTVGLINR
jgi:predicted outer membrane repeat protein